MVSQKGGVGKSTLCHLIAREAAVSGKQVKILDFDTKQMTSTDWVRARLDRDLEPAIEAEPVKNIESALKHNRGYDIILTRRRGRNAETHRGTGEGLRS